MPLKIRINKSSDLVDLDLKSIVQSSEIDVIVNCSAIIGFLNCYKNANKAYLVNSIFPYLISSVCEDLDIRFYHISTEAVFPSGNINVLYSEVDSVKPETIYGKSKYIGEQSIMSNKKSTIIRLPRLFGWGEQIVFKLHQKIQNEEKIKVSTDLYSTPIHIKSVSEEILKIIESKKVSNSGKNFSYYRRYTAIII